ncbi:MAG TPA: hypothetical protein VFM32_03355 [Spongiibacteraceae bacterium]|nr:hypothetical protein [Spongiibacteraceae bacterium]
MQTLYSAINCEQLQSLLATPDTLLLDCRKLNDYKAGQLGSALRLHDGLIHSLRRR